LDIWQFQNLTIQNIRCVSDAYRYIMSPLSAADPKTLLHHAVDCEYLILDFGQERHSMHFYWVQWIPPHSISRAVQGCRGTDAQRSTPYDDTRLPINVR